MTDGIKIIDWKWRSAQGTVGFVLIRNEIGQYSVRIGCTHKKIGLLMVDSITEEVDVKYIAENGAKLSYREAKGFFPQLKREEYKP